MLGKLALQRTNVRFTHLTALAVMAALVVGLFAAMGSANAAPSVSVSFPSDSDAIVDPGTDVTVSVKLSGHASGDTLTLNWIRVSGELDDVVTGTPAAAASDADGDGNNDTTTYTRPTTVVATDTDMQVVVPLGTTPGEYTVSARVTIGSDNTAKSYTGTKVLTVGDAGDSVASAEISLSTIGDATSTVPDNDETGETSEDYFDDGESPPHTRGNNTDSRTAPAGTPIYLKLTVNNSLGKVTDNSAISAVDIIAPGGLLSKHDKLANGNAYTAGSDTPYPLPAVKNSLDYADDEAIAVTYFAVQRDKAGTLDVEAVVVGGGGIAKAEVFTVTFTGGAARISLSSVSSPLGSTGSAYVDVTAVDASGNPASLSNKQVSATVPSDSGANKFAITEHAWLPKPGLGFDPSATADAPGTGDPLEGQHDDDVCNGTADDDDDCVQSSTTVRLFITTTKAAAGEHELEVKLGTADKATATLIVAGTASEISVHSDNETVAVTDIIEVTVTVTDGDGNPIVNDPGSVEYTAAGDLKLSQLGGTNARDLKDGSSSTRFVVVSGAGTAIIIATYDEKLSGTVSVSTAAEEPEAMPAEEASLSCLSETNSFSTWTCEVDSSASEVFEWVRSRGASAIHLWNGSAWVRYSVVDGATVPGSTDFQITQYNQLYISN